MLKETVDLDSFLVHVTYAKNVLYFMAFKTVVSEWIIRVLTSLENLDVKRKQL